MDISGKVSINQKKYSKYIFQKKVEEASFGRKKANQQLKQNEDNYEELSGLNDLDSNILNTKNISSESARLEIQLANTEKKLKKVNNEIKINENLDITGFASSKKLYSAEKKLKKEIADYRKEYRQLGIAYKIADTANQIEEISFNGIKTIKDKIRGNGFIKQILSIIPAYKDKEKAEKAKFLNKKLTTEMTKPAKPNNEEIEILLIKAEKLLY
ncbi:MAG TPA: hypothetical protein P5556_04070 [Candidatus Gastranaerophilales bacterium]|nr:hypothetical protein [Candidatus Gastranaerophilales bacterium]